MYFDGPAWRRIDADWMMAADELALALDFRIAEDATWPQDTTPVRDVVTIVGNLIDNAFDAVTPESGERRVEVSSRVEGDRVVLSVVDSGPGLPPDAVLDQGAGECRPSGDRAGPRRTVGRPARWGDGGLRSARCPVHGAVAGGVEDTCLSPHPRRWT